MQTPVDATATPAWARLTELKENFTPDLRGWFAADPGRAEHFTRTAGDLHVDLSKNLVNDAVVDALVALADEVGLAFFGVGEHHRSDFAISSPDMVLAAIAARVKAALA